MFISALPDPEGVEEGKMEKGHSIFWFSIIQHLCMNESLSPFLWVEKPITIPPEWIESG